MNRMTSYLLENPIAETYDENSLRGYRVIMKMYEHELVHAENALWEAWLTQYDHERNKESAENSRKAYKMIRDHYRRALEGIVN